MALAGWQAVGLFDMPLGVLLGTLPTAALGAGVIFREVFRARGERQRIDRADDAEQAAIRSVLEAQRSRREGGVDPTA